METVFFKDSNEDVVVAKKSKEIKHPNVRDVTKKLNSYCIWFQFVMDGLIIVKKKILEAKTSAVLCWNLKRSNFTKCRKKKLQNLVFFMRK